MDPTPATRAAAYMITVAQEFDPSTATRRWSNPISKSACAVALTLSATSVQVSCTLGSASAISSPLRSANSKRSRPVMSGSGTLVGHPDAHSGTIGAADLDGRYG